MKQKVVENVLMQKKNLPQLMTSSAFAPSNIALCKYWGKRNTVLRLPMNNSLSVSLGQWGTTTKLTILNEQYDKIFLNNQQMTNDTVFSKRLIGFLNLFRTSVDRITFLVETHSNLPIAAGLASSASGFAALTVALNKLFGWDLSKEELSILARLGSGSATRSLWHGFVKWHAGHLDDGMDSYAEKINVTWEELCIGLLILDQGKKKISSSSAMAQVMDQSTLYKTWPRKANIDFCLLEQAIKQKNIAVLGSVAQKNSARMHATMQDISPPIIYNTATTNEMINTVLSLQAQKHDIYFTQDAGPNLVLLFLKKDLRTVLKYFSPVKIIFPFASKNRNADV